MSRTSRASHPPGTDGALLSTSRDIRWKEWKGEVLSTTDRLIRLSPEQLALLNTWRERWLRIGLSCQPLEYEAAVDAAGRAYAVAGLKPPASYLACDSPVSASLVVSRILGRAESVWDRVNDRIRSSAEASLASFSGGLAGEPVRRHVYNRVVNAVAGATQALIGRPARRMIDKARRRPYPTTLIGDYVKGRIRHAVEQVCPAFIWSYLYGSHDTGLGAYEYYLSVCNLRCCTPLQPLLALARVCGWWMPYENLVVLTHRPREIHRDTNGHLHNPEGMAVTYRDGWGLFAWHGVLVDRWVIEEPGRIDLEMINTESNVEKRRVYLERYGYGQYLLDSDAQVIDRDEDGTLYRQEMGEEYEPLVMVRVKNATVEPDGSRRDYFLRVPPYVRTVRAAIAWTFNVREEEYVLDRES